MRKGLLVVLAACGSGGGGDPVDATALPAWERGLPPSSVMGPWRTLEPARGIIHLHSPYSHDACDGEGRDEETGALDEACLADLRAALCETRMDYAALTDHDATMADEAFEDLLLVRGDDQLVRDELDQPVANRIACAGGHRVLLTVGSENPYMPIMLRRHVDGTIEERHAIYDGRTPTDAAAWRAAGAIVWTPHVESKEIDEVRAIAPDGLEVYQLHANIDPDIREDYLGLDGSQAFEDIAQFADTNENGPEPDLALLAFLDPNRPALAMWDELLGEGLRLAPSGGTDAHQNALPITLRDGERGDSYRRMMRWFSSVVLAADRTDLDSVRLGILEGRMFVAFELMGTPAGFDVHAGATELGGVAEPGQTLEVTLPTVHGLDPSLPPPEIVGRVIRVTAEGATVVAEGPGSLSASLDTPGAYRVEVEITPLHLAGYLGNLGPEMAERPLPWIYTSPIYVE
jgi:hypothetical protein